MTEPKPEIVATLTPGMLALIENARNAIIERCAQIAEQPFMADGREIAAEIRKLKGER